MKKITVSRKRGGLEFRPREALKNSMLVVSVFFLAGVAAGAALGSGSAVYDISYYVSRSTDMETGVYGFFKLLWGVARFHVLLLALATSYLGFIVVPFVAAFKGYLISCSVASIIATGAANSFPLALLTVGLPALFYMPCFFVLSVDALVLSKRLAVSRLGPACARERTDISGHLLLSAILLALSAAFEQWVLPRILLSLF